MRGNTVPIEVELKRGKVAKTIALYQYDYGQKLIFTNVDLPPYYEVHFSNEMHGEAITSIGDETGVEIPDDFLATGLPVYLWLFLHAGSSDGETEYQGVIPVIKRASISDQEPTPTQQTAIEQAIEALNAAIESSDASDSEAWAIGKRGTQDVSSDDETYHNNSKYYAGQAESSATSAGTSSTSAGTNALKAEGYAVGEQNGTPVADGTYYQNNAKYYATQAGDSATSASGSATAAEGSAEDAEAYAVGKRDGVDVTSGDPAYENNAKYYAGEAADAALEAITAAASASAAYGTALLAPNYSSSSTYAVGDHVIYTGNYYECNTANSAAEAWTAAHWTQLTVGGETSALKSAFDELEDDVEQNTGDISTNAGNIETNAANIALKVNKPTTSPNGTSGQFLKTNGDGTTAWDDPLSEPVADAVADWLDDHPEATTTVQDGSLTEAKFTAVTLEKIKNDYVTPQMYGAKADGSTDDTQAIQDAFDSNFNVYFPDGTYMTSGVTLSKKKHVKFGNIILKANTLYQAYVVNVTTVAHFHGTLYIEGNSKPLVGIIFDHAGDSIIDHLIVQHCLAWGVYLEWCGHMTIQYVYAAMCGTKINTSLSYESDTSVKLTGQLSARDEYLLGTDYAVNLFAYDTSGYDDPTMGSGFTLIRRLASYDDDDGSFACGEYVGNRFPNDYLNKSCTICFGGGILIGSMCLSQINLGIVDTRTGASGLTTRAQYGDYIGSFYSQGDAIPIVVENYCMGNYIGSITAESPLSRYTCINFLYDYSVIVTRSTGYYTDFNSYQVRSICSGASTNVNPILLKGMRKFYPRKYTVGNVYVSDQSENEVILINKNSFYIELYDKEQGMYSRNLWGIKTVYFMPTMGLQTDITISLNSELISDGYTIDGGTSGSITFARPTPSSWFKVQIYLYEKVFYLIVEELVKGVSGGKVVNVDAFLSSTSENPVQNKAIYAAIGDIETLLAAL